MQSAAKKRPRSPSLEIIWKPQHAGHTSAPRAQTEACESPPIGAAPQFFTRRLSRKKMARRVDPAHEKHRPARAPTSFVSRVRAEPQTCQRPRTRRCAYIRRHPPIVVVPATEPCGCNVAVPIQRRKPGMVPQVASVPIPKFVRSRGNSDTNFGIEGH